MARSGPLFTLRLRWNVRPSDVDRVFRGLGEDLRDWREPMAKIRGVLAAMFRELFQGQQSPDGQAWEGPTADYKRRKMRRGGSTATLRLQGHLERSLTREGGGAGGIRRIASSREGLPRLIYGTRLAYAAPLQFGSSKRRRSLPARPFVGLTDDARDESLDELEQHLQRKLDEAARELGKGAARA